jgi:hypothetical protein
MRPLKQALQNVDSAVDEWNSLLETADRELNRTAGESGTSMLGVV